jgi:transposase
VKDFTEETPTELIYLPPGSPKLNLVRECWRQFKQFLGNHSFDSFADLRETIPAAPNIADAPKLHDCP